MSEDLDVVVQDAVPVSALPVFEPAPETTQADERVIALQQFVAEFGDGLLEAVSTQNPPIYDGTPDAARDAVMDALRRKPFAAQRAVVQAVCRLLVEADQPAAVINAEMGTGKTMMAISAAAVLQQSEQYGCVLVISPPHLVYKWRREILETIPGAKVTVLNGPDTLRKLLKVRDGGAAAREFFVLGRVRMRMGFHWRAAFNVRRLRVETKGEDGAVVDSELREVVVCPCCGTPARDSDGNPYQPSLFPLDKRVKCGECSSPLWALIRPTGQPKSRREVLVDALCGLPTIGKVTAGKLVGRFCVFRAMPATDSDASRPPIPSEVGRAFRRMPATP